MTNQNTIPAEKVRELIEKFKEDTKHDCIVADLRALLPAPPQPTTGLLGRWAKHPEYGDVVCGWDKPDTDGRILVRWVDENATGAANWVYAPLPSLTFPEQTTKPEDVPAGEAWLVDVNSPLRESHKSILALKAGTDFWRTSDGITTCSCWHDSEITLISPLAPERPVSDLQAKSTERALDRVKAKYDELESKYREAQERIKTLEQASTPRTVTTLEEYAALPVGSVVSDNQNYPFSKDETVGWSRPNSTNCYMSRDLARTTRTVLRYGWGDEQPAWRIEAHNPDNFRVGEFIIDIDGDSGTVTPEWIEMWDPDEDTFGARRFAPFIVFPSKDAATPEAIAEAKKARDKETGE